MGSIPLGSKISNGASCRNGGSNPPGSTMNSKQLGVFGEKIAENYLKKRKYKILDKNYIFRIPGSPQKAEIDIIAKKENIINFVEVKTLFYSNSFLPEEKVDYLKQRKIIMAAESWLLKKKISLDNKWQIDVISVQIDSNKNKAKIRHFQNTSY